MDLPIPRIAIIGGGLAGLAAANALASRGFAVEIFEQATVLGEVGAGINISYQAVKALRAMGLGETVAAVANTPPGSFSRNMQTGERLDYRDMQAGAAHYGAPHYVFHRADLLDALASGVDPARLHLDHRLTGLEERASGVALTFANGATSDADVVIGADGIHSVVRHALYGDDNPTYTGQMVWRALVKGSDIAPELLEPSGHVQWFGPGCHLVSYYLRGREVVNVVTQADTDEWVAEGWSIAGDPDEMRASFPNPEPRLKALLGAVTTCSKWGLFLRPPTFNWGRGRIQLIGDAAHAMLPNAGQGAAQSFEDAYTLARWLEAEANDPVEALRNFRRIRIPRVHGVQRLSVAYARLKHMRDREAQKTLIATANAGKAHNADWIWGYDPVEGWDKAPTVPSFE